MLDRVNRVDTVRQRDVLTVMHVNEVLSHFIINKGMPFADARKQILASRWQPDPASASRETAPIGVENALLEEGISEVEFCAMDQALCTFKYRKENACLRLTTQGEALKDMTLLQWTYRCKRD